MSVGHPIPEIQHFQNLTLRIQGQGHEWCECWKPQHVSNIISTRIPFIPCQSAIPFLRYDFFKIWPWKSKVKVMVEVQVESHKVGVTSYRFTSLWFHVNRPSHSWDKAFSNFDLENSRSRSNDHDVAQLHGSRQFHRTLNGINPSSSFRDIGSIRSGWPDLTSFWPMGK